MILTILIINILPSETRKAQVDRETEYIKRLEIKFRFYCTNIFGKKRCIMTRFIRDC